MKHEFSIASEIESGFDLEIVLEAMVDEQETSINAGKFATE